MRKSHLLLAVLFLVAVHNLLSCDLLTTTTHSLETNVSPSQAGSISPTEGEYDEGTEVTVEAYPNDDWLFKTWKGDYSGTDNPHDITMNADKALTAIFERREYPLNIAIEGDGSVREEIVEEPSTLDYEHGTLVKLTAEPEEGWRFVRWEGDLQSNETPETIIVEKDMNITVVFSSLECDGPVALQVGESVTVPFPDPCGVVLPAEDNAVYRVGVIARDYQTTGSTVSEVPGGLVLRGQSDASAVAMPLAAAGRVGSQHSVSSFQPSSATGAFDRETMKLIRATEKVHMQLRREEYRRFGSATLATPTGRPGDAIKLQSVASDPDEKRSFYAKDPDSDTRLEIEATLRVNGENIIYYQDDDVAGTDNEINDAEIEELLEYYNQNGKPVIDESFGGLGPDGTVDNFEDGPRQADDLDGNGKFIILQIPDSKMLGGAAGYVSSCDRYPRPGNASFGPACERSNEAEITYILSPLSTAGLDFFKGTIVHEAKHLSSQGYAIYGGRGHQPSWIEEGTAEIAHELGSRRAAGFSADEEVGYSDIYPVTAETFGMAVVHSRARQALRLAPETGIIGAPDPDGTPVFYGSSWLFHRYLADGHSGGDVAGLFRQMNTQETGRQAIEDATGESFHDLLSEFIAAAGVEGNESARQAASHRFISYDHADIASMFAEAPWPYFQATAGYPSDSFVMDPVYYTAPNYFEFTSPGNRQLQLDVLYADAEEPVAAEEEVVLSVIRVQ